MFCDGLLCFVMFCGVLWWFVNQSADILQTSFFKYSKISKKNKKHI